MLKKVTFFPSQPRRAKTRLSTPRTQDLGRGEHTAEVREQDQGPTRLREIAMAGRERLLACQPKPWRRLAGFFNILLGEHHDLPTLPRLNELKAFVKIGHGNGMCHD